MSNHAFVYLACDKCGGHLDGEDDDSMRGVRAKAKAVGWKLGKGRDFCPKCSAEIAEAVKQAAAGNL